jgi:Invasion associated locus B (IalB) protein
MQIRRPWQLALSLLVAAALAAPALAQQPPATQQPQGQGTTPPPPPAPPPPKKPKPKPAVTTETPPAATPPAATPPAGEPAPAAKKKPAKPEAAPPAAAAPPPAPPVPGIGGMAKPTLLGQYGEWGAYTASPGGKKICFAIAKPTVSETTPPGKPRNPAYMFISSRPADKVSNEVSIIIGYPFKPSSDATLEIGSTTFALYTQQDGAWIKNGPEEAKLIEAMRAGQNATVKGMSSKGTHSTDTFSLKGLAQALDRTGQDCK